MKQFSAIFILIFSIITVSYANKTINLSGSGWRVMLDSTAEWETDKLYLPDELPSLEKLPINPPTGGWEVLNSNGKTANVPLTMEEYFSNGINTSTTHGVSWAWRNFNISDSLKGKIILLNVERTRMRAEIYINHKLAAYDVIGDTPYSFDITKYVSYGKLNQIAIRLTNPGGRRGWVDISNQMWGKYRIASSGKDFSTIGNIEIEAKPKVYISDIFVKNVLPTNGKKIEVEVSITNKTNKTFNVELPLKVVDNKNRLIKESKIIATISKGKNCVKEVITVDKGELWSPSNPTLYTLKAELTNSDYESDKKEQIFGIRTFEVLSATKGGANYYLNGKRFFFRTSIDWGYYAPTGDFATAEMAKKSIKAAKSMNQNGLSFHRNIGEPLVMEYADSLGICIYEEPGGFHTVQKLDTNSFTIRHINEKISRMIKRDRNHPSVIIYSLSNEKNEYHDSRKRALELINRLDDSRLVINTSGPSPSMERDIAHIRPYQSEIRFDYRDEHTALNRSAIYTDSDFYQETHRTDKDNKGIYFLGEVNSVSGPDNWYKTYKDSRNRGNNLYCTNIYKENYDKIDTLFEKWNLSRVGSRNIKRKEDVSMQAGRGMMYAHARHAQSIMCNDIVDGFALNGWTPGPQTEGNNDDWSSAILDQGRNIKAPADSYTYWVRPLQISLSRENGRYFNVGDSVKIESNLINQAILAKGDYIIKYSITDSKTGDNLFTEEREVEVKGGETFAQSLGSVDFKIMQHWAAGYVTLNGTLYSGGDIVATGSEQILLSNRASYKSQLKDVEIGVIKWDRAKEALKESGAKVIEFSDKSRPKVIAVGDITRGGDLYGKNEINSWEKIDILLNQVDEGATMIVKFDKHWADILYHKKILSTPVTQWGGNQTGQWFGNGWGYLDHFVGYNSTANGGTLGTTSWEFPRDPIAFYPFESDYRLSVYGVYMSRSWLCKNPPIGFRVHELQPTMAVIIGAIDYGKGKIILSPSYHIDSNNAFNDMLFFNSIIYSLNGNF